MWIASLECLEHYRVGGVGGPPQHLLKTTYQNCQALGKGDAGQHIINDPVV